MARKIFVGDFLYEIKMMEETADKRGVKLYGPEDIAEHFGIMDVSELNRQIRDARKVYRDILQKKAEALKKEGCDEDKIAEKMGVSYNTAKILLMGDKEGEEHVKKVTEARQKSFDDMMDSFKKNQEEIDKLFGRKGPFWP